MTAPSYSARLDALAAQAARNRPAALKELAAGKKRGHWVWWLFPTIASRGGDMNSVRQRGRGGKRLGPTGADLADEYEAVAYLRNAQAAAACLALSASVADFVSRGDFDYEPF